MPQTIAIVGTGIIGRSWIRVFARAGCATRVYDVDPAQRNRALEWARDSALCDEDLGLAEAGQAAYESRNILSCDSLEEAVNGCSWVQENGPETLSTKQGLFADLDAVAPRDAILASSTSAHDMTEIADGLVGADRCVVAHPVNPPHVIPVVEVLPGQATRIDVLQEALVFLKSVGQSPVEIDRYLPGFLLNRLQAALLREAIALVESGAASVDAIDTVVRDGLGLRWALLGPFGTGHGNADGGASEYYRMYRESYRSLWEELATSPELSDDTINRIHAGVVAIYGPDAVTVLNDWRDRSVRRIRKLKETDPPPSVER